MANQKPSGIVSFESLAYPVVYWYVGNVSASVLATGKGSVNGKFGVTAANIGRIMCATCQTRGKTISINRTDLPRNHNSAVKEYKTKHKVVFYE